MAYRLEFTEDPQEFLDHAGDWLASAPVLGTVVTTMAHRALAADLARRPRPAHPQWWVTVTDDAGAVVGAAMRTAPFRPYPVYALTMPDHAALALGAALAERGEADAGVNGMLPGARIAAHQAARLAGGHVDAGRDARLWVLGRLTAPPDPPGWARLASADDLALVIDWFTEFHDAADVQAGRAPGSHADTTDPAEVERRVRGGQVWLWADPAGDPVHLTSYNPPSFGVARIGPVYTPDAHRGRGYAAACVALVAGLLRAEGAEVCLFTDADNPVSTRVYQRVGFEAVVSTADHRVVLPPREGSLGW